MNLCVYAFITVGVVATWLLPRRFGATGLIGVQLLIATGFVALGAACIATGLWVYDDVFMFVGLLANAFLFNCLLLPVGLVALWRRARSRPAAGRGFEVTPLQSK